LPLISDPVYGYPSVNVEAQKTYSASFLNWMRRLIHVRKGHKAFGRGEIQFLDPSNTKILVYLRSYEEELLLIVNNLARHVQPVELDLHMLNGYVPYEMIGNTRFPAIGEWPYFLTLGPHAFYWFRLERG